MTRSPQGLLCDFEWIRKTWNVTKNVCDGLEQRLEFAGDYEVHDCSVRLREATREDTGLWTCQLESYKFGGGRGSGRLLSKDIYVQVMAPSTLPTTTTTEIPSTRATFNLSTFNVKREDASLPTKHNLMEVSLAKFLPYSVTILVVVIFLVLFTVIVVFHRLKATQQRQSNQTNQVISIQPSPETTKTHTNDLIFLKSAFPHLMRFPSDDLGLNL